MLIFNLHHVEPPGVHARYADRQHLTITPNGLRSFIRTLRLARLEIVSMREAMDTLLDPSAPPGKAARQVVITLDDGYVNNMTYAAPVFEQERCPAIIFVLPGRFGGTNEWDQADLPESERDPLLTLEQMKELGRSPYITFGSHGMRHLKFSQLDDQTLKYELQQSHEILSKELGDAYLPVLAYPWGDYSDNVLAAMQNSPYRCALTVKPARWEAGCPVFEIPRYSAYHRDGNPLIALAKLARHKLLF